jgi:uncharacterized Zn-finger protein
MAGKGVTMAEVDSRGVVVVKPNQLPAFCPNPTMPLWSWHPRVYLDVVPTGKAMCPYCGTRYELEGGPLKHGH